MSTSTSTNTPELESEPGTEIITAIDPSINSLGYAVFVNKRLVSYGTVKSSDDDKQKTLAVRIQTMIADLAVKMEGSMHAQTVVIEEPEMFSSATSHAAVHNSSLKKLIMIVGGLVWHSFLLKATCVLVPVTTWKGQLPKHITKTRMETKYNVRFRTTDECDAVGIGDWYIQASSRTPVTNASTKQDAQT